MPVYQHLGSGHILVPGPHDLVHSGHGLSTVGQGCNAPWPSHLENSIATRNIRRHQRSWICHHSLAWGRHGYYLTHACNPGREHGHQNRARVCRRPSRYVTPHNIHRSGDAASQYTFSHLYGPHLALKLCLVEFRDVLGRRFQAVYDFGIHLFIGRCYLLFSDFQVGRSNVVLMLAVVFQGNGIAAAFDIVYNPADIFIDR